MDLFDHMFMFHCLQGLDGKLTANTPVFSIRLGPTVSMTLLNVNVFGCLRVQAHDFVFQL